METVMAQKADNHPHAKGNHKTRLTETLALLMLILGGLLVLGFVIVKIVL
jgi:hypothetical protein